MRLVDLPLADLRHQMANNYEKGALPPPFSGPDQFFLLFHTNCSWTSSLQKPMLGGSLQPQHCDPSLVYGTPSVFVAPGATNEGQSSMV
jgi:hypothetical protein